MRICLPTDVTLEACGIRTAYSQVYESTSQWWFNLDTSFDIVRTASRTLINVLKSDGKRCDRDFPPW